MIGIMEIDAVVHPSPVMALYGMRQMATHLPRESPKPRMSAPRRVRFDWEQKHNSRLVTAVFCIHSLHEYFRDGLPVDAEPDFYAAIDITNAEQLHNLYEARQATFWLGHVQTYAKLVLNANGVPSANHLQGLGDKARIMLQKIRRLLEDYEKAIK